MSSIRLGYALYHSQTYKEDKQKPHQIRSIQPELEECESIIYEGKKGLSKMYTDKKRIYRISHANKTTLIESQSWGSSYFCTVYQNGDIHVCKLNKTIQEVFHSVNLKRKIELVIQWAKGKKVKQESKDISSKLSKIQKKVWAQRKKIAELEKYYAKYKDIKYESDPQF